MARRNSRRSAVSLSTSTAPHLSASTRSSRRTNTSCVQSCHRSAGSRAFRQHVWQYLLMSVTAFELAVKFGVADAAFAGDAASAPSTTATITWRELGLGGRNLLIRGDPLGEEPVSDYTDTESGESRPARQKNRDSVPPAGSAVAPGR